MSFFLLEQKIWNLLGFLMDKIIIQIQNNFVSRGQLRAHKAANERQE